MDRKLITDLVVNGGVQLAIRLRGLLFIPIISGTLGVSQFGAYTQIIAVSQVLAVTFGLGLPQALVRFGQSDEYHSGSLYSSLLSVSLLSCGSAFVVVFLAAERMSVLTLNTVQYAAAYRVGSFLMLTRVAIRMGRNYFRMDSRLKTFSLLQGAKAYLLVAGVTAVVLAFDGDITEIMLVMVLIEVIFAIAIHIQILREVGLAVPTFPDLASQLRFSVPLSVSTVASNFSARADRLLIGFFIGATAVGSYSIAYQIAVGISVFLLPITQVFFPKISSFVEKSDYQQSAAYLWQGIRYFLLIAVPSVAGLFLVGPDLVVRMTGPIENFPSASVIFLLVSLGIVFKGVDRIFSVIVSAEKQTAKLSAIRISGALINVLLNLVAIPAYGVFGAAVTTLFTYLFTATAVYLASRRIITIPIDAMTVSKICTASTGMVAFIWIFDIETLASTIVVGAASYGVLIFAMRELTVCELRRLTRLDETS